MTRPLRVLIVEDSEEDATLLLEDLASGGFDVTHARVQTGAAMRNALDAQAWDVVISDYSMPGFSGIDALGVIKDSGIDVPLIIVSGTIGEETAIAALKGGAADFFVKGRLARLIPAIEREMREAEGRRQRRSVEVTLSDTRERMRFALESAGVGTWEMDLASGTTVWSDIFEQLHGLETGTFDGTRDAYAACIHAEDRQRVLDGFVATLRGRANSRFEYRTVWPDGSVRWIAGFGRTFCDEQGEPVRAAGIGMDVTAQKDLEEQFRQAQKMEAIGGLAAGIAHDFNNLLTVVSGYCELLAPRFADDPAASQDLGEIRRATNSATALTRQLLAFSRRQILAPRMINLNTILLDSQKMVRRLVEENIRIDLRLAATLPTVNVDAGQLEQVLLNLVINARDAMLDGGAVTITTDAVTLDGASARAHMNAPPGAYVILSVSDTGTGMSSEVQARLFEPFFTTKERGRGTGLGLATVYGIVKQSGGHVSVWSKLGKGTTFKVYLPAASQADIYTRIEPKLMAPRVSNGSETVLVVEDDAALRMLSGRILQRQGYTVLSASDGDHAQSICSDHRGPIHVVLMDMVMPGRNGREVGDWIVQRRPHTRIVYTSGYTDKAIVVGGVLEPGTAFLQKPFTAETLVSKIREALS